MFNVFQCQAYYNRIEAVKSGNTFIKKLVFPETFLLKLNYAFCQLDKTLKFFVQKNVLT